MASPVLARLDALERALAARGFPAMSPWWRETIVRFYTSIRRQLVLRVGRRGGKSSTLCRVAVLEALYGEHTIPPGDLGVVAIISVSRDEAAQRLRTIKAILDALGVKWRPCDGGIELTERPIAFKVYAASIAGVSGFTCICAICDEVAKWRDADTGANPATEVLASLRPTLATQRNARIYLSSSPLGKLDAHAAAFDEGETEFQLVAFAPTWVANPTLTEADTRALEPNEAKHQREYGALPTEGSEESLFSAAALDRATRSAPEELLPARGHHYAAMMDPAVRRNGWTLCVAVRRYVQGHLVRSIALAREWRSRSDLPLDSTDVLTEIAAVLKPFELRHVSTDQFHGDSLASIGRQIGLTVSVEPMTGPDKLDRYETVGNWFADDEIELPSHPVLRADLLGVRRRITPNGFTVHLPESANGRHCDFAPSAVGALTRAVLAPSVWSEQTEGERQERLMVRAEEKRFGSADRKACATCRGAGCSRCAGLGIVSRRRGRPRPAWGAYPP